MYKLYTLYSLELGWVELKLTVTAMQRAKEMGIVTASETAMQTPMVTQTAQRTGPQTAQKTGLQREAEAVECKSRP